MMGVALIRSEELESAWPGLIEPWMGSGHVQAAKVSPPESADPSTLVFAGLPEQLATALDRKAGLIVASGKLTPPTELPAGTRLYRSPNVPLAMAAILPRFDRKRERFVQSPAIHPQSSVHPNAKLGRDVTVGPFAVVGDGAIIGDGAIVGAGSVVERGAKVGARTLLHPRVFLGAGCEIGADGEIHPGTTIGSDGFGFARDKDGRAHKLPQLGRVVIGDRVEIGANCAIDRAAFAVTRIGDGVKFDNLIHIAHNCEIGDDSLVAAGFMIAGSTKIGKRFMTGGNSVVADHVTIADDVVLAGRSTVTNDVPAAGAYGGYPLLPMKEYLRNLAGTAHVAKLRKQVSRLFKHLGLEEDEK